MTKILVWNIQNFTNGRINPTAKAKKAKNVQETIRLNHILDTLRSNPPDIFSVLEVQPGSRKLNDGDLVQGTGEQGCLFLLNAINNDPQLGDLNNPLPANRKPWRIVPPLVSGAGGRTEAVAVFYNSLTVKFMGPSQWKGGVAYPAPWNNGAITSGDNKAAQILFKKAVQGQGPVNKQAIQIDFPTAQHRSPYLTQFLELKDHQRIIYLYSIHTSPAEAVEGTANIALITDLQRQLKNHEVIVIAGDFNVTQDPGFKVNGVTKANASYGKLVKIGFTQEFDAAKIIPAPGGKVTQYHYVTTHLRPRKTKKVQDPDWKAVGVTQRKAADPWGDYPPYGYMSPAPEDTLDNIFTKYPPHQPAVKSPAGIPYPSQSQNSMIVNRVVGAPYNLPLVGGGGVAQHPQGLVNPYPVDMNLWIPQYHSGLRRDNTRKAGLTSMFRGFNNYGKIRLTSDHMAVYVEI
ncbi:MAG: hypothetical protein DWQ58_14970 [Microcystis aeruginosa TA09]|nr:MAG: hypothetical protein DWQ58_14970 [Microcystis aeruginosa TA09]